MEGLVGVVRHPFNPLVPGSSPGRPTLLTSGDATIKRSHRGSRDKKRDKKAAVACPHGHGRRSPAGAASIDVPPSGAYRVRVYAGVDPLTGKQLMLTERVPPGPSAGKEAEKVRTRLLRQVDERRSPRTRATVSQLLDRYTDSLTWTLLVPGSSPGRPNIAADQRRCHRSRSSARIL